MVIKINEAYTISFGVVIILSKVVFGVSLNQPPRKCSLLTRISNTLLTNTMNSSYSKCASGLLPNITKKHGWLVS
jgi:hypothetical protein